MMHAFPQCIYLNSFKCILHFYTILCVCLFFLFLVPEKNMYTRSQVTYIQLPFFTLSFAFSSSNVFLHYPRTINNVMKAVKRKRGGGRLR